jgi:L-fuculose-phosphate aldolase
VERAYWWTEILDAYCRILMLARNLGGVHYFSEQKERELLNLKAKWGFADPRNTDEFKNCDICASDIFRDSWSRSGVVRRAFDAPPPMNGNSADQASRDGIRPEPSRDGRASDSGPIERNSPLPPASEVRATSSNGSGRAAEVQEALIQAITDRVMAELSRR